MNNSTIKPSKCKQCGSPFHSAMWHKPRKPIAQRTFKKSLKVVDKPRKPLPRPTKRIKQYGKRAKDLSDWVRDVARPYLYETQGQVCNVMYCYQKENLDVDHILGKGSHPELKMSLSNVQLLCRHHHQQKTIGIVLQYKSD